MPVVAVLYDVRRWSGPLLLQRTSFVSEAQSESKAIPMSLVQLDLGTVSTIDEDYAGS